VIVLEGVNNLNRVADPVMAGALIAGYRRIIAASHQAGLRVIGATILPFGGYTSWSPFKELQRQRVNAWIRKGGAFDGVIDVATAVGDPSDQRRISPSFDSGDHLHLNNGGYAAIAFAVALDGL
jgi:lysophospholipase L1-like esterase